MLYTALLDRPSSEDNMRVFAIAGIDTNAKNESSATKRLKFFIIARNCVVVANLDKKDVKSDGGG